jgi:hypothetical protein
MFEKLELPHRPPMAMYSSEYLEAVQRAAEVRRAAMPWLLLPYDERDLWVARHRTAAMRVVVACCNVVRRVVKWYRGRLKLAAERRFFKMGNRN